MNVNKKHKDSVFSFIFNNPDILRELYSAIADMTIAPDVPIDINTLTDVLYMDQLNDLSFTIDNRLVVLIEHQSTVNENIPFRLLEYIGRVYEKIVDRKKMYKTNLVKIHKPEFIVLYNGIKPHPDYRELRLSDAFMNIEGLKSTEDRKIPLELVVQVYNINHGHNREILKRSETLDSYSVFIDKVRENQKADLPLAEAVKNAIKYCIDHNKLKVFFEKNSSEVFNMLTEWNQEEYMEVALEEAREEGLELGIKEGIEKGIEQTARNLLAIGITIDDIVRATGLPLEKVRVLASEGS